MNNYALEFLVSNVFRLALFIFCQSLVVGRFPKQNDGNITTIKCTAGSFMISKLTWNMLFLIYEQNTNQHNDYQTNFMTINHINPCKIM